MGIHEQVELIIGENYKIEYLINPDYYEDEIEELKNDLFNNYKDNQFDFDNEDIVDTLPKLFDYYEGMDMTKNIIDCLREKDYDKLYNLYALMVYPDIVMDMEQQHNKKIQNIKTDFKELFEITGEEIYFRNSKIDNAITERFNDKDNNNIIAYINTEETTEEPNLEYYTVYGGSKEFNKLLIKYNLMFEWETNCVAYLYFDEDDDDSDDDSDDDN
jgi:hypothetical protein